GVLTRKLIDQYKTHKRGRDAIVGPKIAFLYPASVRNSRPVAVSHFAAAEGGFLAHSDFRFCPAKTERDSRRANPLIPGGLRGVGVAHSDFRFSPDRMERDSRSAR